uniref:Uncharacterized protein n=1 Tax=Trieres chinensis TaxID=1514140 RepID=A0A7S2EJE6_TRICV|mmetsp:Transcript_26405/g.54080  ORF Transcript_26405/g.54080 Transcript_26405/m.54080 type:complete len:334 (+) Transcript_26405:2-1003(+)
MVAGEGEDWSARRCPLPNKNKALDPADVVAGYRPLKATAIKGKKMDTVRHVHVVTITRKCARGVGSFWGILPGRVPHFRREYSVTVTEGLLDKTPLVTSDKVYRPMTLGGWPVRCEDGLWDGNDNEKEAKARELISVDLAAAASHLPPKAQELLREGTSIWINRSQKYGPKRSPVTGRGCCFHPDSEWLVENGMSAKKEGGVEIYRASEYPNDRDLWGPGGVMLHELSHAFHKKHTPGGFENKDVKRCFDRAMERGLYDRVRVHGRQGPECRAYACQDPMEYFAELSVAFLGGLDKDVEHNKWFPFNREQLQKHDPDAFKMMKKLWGVDDEAC